MRSMLPRALAVLVGVACALAGAGGLARAGPEEERVAEALAHFRKGNELFKQKAWAAAAAELLESRRLHPTRNATANAAYCLRKLGRYDEALDLYESVLRDFATVPADLKEEAQRAILELRGLVGTIEIGECEPGAAISIDGQSRGEHPALGALRVAAGSHTVRLYKAGFEPFETRVEVAGRKTVTVNAKLVPLAASGRLKILEQGARTLDVLLDGSLVGKTPWEGRVPVGEHVVLLRGEDDVGTAPAAVTVERDRTVPLTLAAEELAATLRVEPVPASARVAIDAVAVGRGIWEGRLRVGDHRVEVAEPGFATVTSVVTLERGRRERVEITLERDASSPFWRRPERRARFVVEIGAAPALVPFGGGVAGNCIDECKLSASIGTHGILRGGYELGAGFGFGVAGGWLTAQQAARGRATALKVEGQPDRASVADDHLAVRSLLLGGWLGYRLDTPYPVHALLTAGALLGGVSDARSGEVRSSAGGAASPFGTLVEQHDAPFFYLTPELRLGLPITEHVELTAGLEVPILVATGRAVWSNATPVNAGGAHEGTFPAEALTGAVLVAFAPGVGARYDF